MKKDIIKQLNLVKQASYELLELGGDKSQQVLFSLAAKLKQNTHKIIEENQKDLTRLDPNDPKYDRLLLNEERLHSIINSIENVALLTFTDAISEEKTLTNGLKIQKISVPLGVVAVIYESRPNVTIDVFALCFKTQNACVLKGGKEAHFSNQCLVSFINETLNDHGINNHMVYLLPPEREATDILLHAVKLVDVCIPRGSQSLINYVREQAKIPVIETGAGIVHTYFDQKGDLDKGRLIINNAKTRRVSVCNALDTLLIHESRLNDLPELIRLLAEKKVEIFADQKSYQILQNSYPIDQLHLACPEDFGQEFLSLKISIKTVSSLEEALNHIRHYSSGHSEAIITEDSASAHYFSAQVDAAAVYVNASTAFTDGEQFGLGAEIGISTQKLHARGPMALDALRSYKWVVWGNGQIRA